MERIIFLKNQNSLYFSLRFEPEDLPKPIFCRDCPFFDNACFIHDSKIANRVVAKIKLHHTQVTELSRRGLQPKCGDISEFL